MKLIEADLTVSHKQQIKVLNYENNLLKIITVINSFFGCE